MSERHIEAGERYATSMGLFSPATFSLIVLVATIVTMLTCALATPLVLNQAFAALRFRPKRRRAA